MSETLDLDAIEAALDYGGGIIPEDQPRVIAKLVAEVERLRAYADKLAAGLPEGMLPRDVENLRQANTCAAVRCASLAAENERMKAALEQVKWVKADGYWRCPWCWAYRGRPHKTDCLRQAALSTLAETPPTVAVLDPDTLGDCVWEGEP